jgi:hypothetical protein
VLRHRHMAPAGQGVDIRPLLDGRLIVNRDSFVGAQ